MNYSVLTKKYYENIYLTTVAPSVEPTETVEPENTDAPSEDEELPEVPTDEELHVVPVEELVKDALLYEYEDGYVRNGNFDITDPYNIKYTCNAMVQMQDNHAVLNDFARYLGAYYRTNNVDTIVYNGVDYVWDVNGTLKGSNYTSADGTTLVSIVTSDMLEEFNNTGEANIDVMINNENIHTHISLVA